MKNFVYILLILFVAVFLTACTNNQTANSNSAFASQNIEVQNMNIKINNKDYSIILENNETVKALTEKLPMTINMSELNGNEKYYYLSDSLPQKSENIGTVKTGDIMLFGDNCLVIFYKSFKTSYRYTKIGHIENNSELEKVLGKGSIEVTITK